MISADEKNNLHVESVEIPRIVETQKVDSVLQFLEDHPEFEDLDVTEEEYRKIHKKVNLHILPLITAITTLLFMDKNALSYASILGIFESTKLTNALYDDVNSLFYVGYTLGQVLNFVLQKHDLSRFLTIIIFIWSVLMFLHVTAFNFGGLATVRLFLGFFESVVTPLTEVTLFQFYTPQTRAIVQPLFYIGCVGFAPIITGFIAYGVLHIENSIPPWKIFMIIIGCITLLMTVIIYFFYPSDPTKAKFLTTREKYILIKEVQRKSKAAITQHHIKKHQVIECLKDPITWLFALFSFLVMLSNNLYYQQNLLYVSLGVSNLGSTLVSVAGGGFSTLFAFSAALLIYFFPNNSFWICIYSCLPCIVGGIAMITLPWSNKLGLLAVLVLAGSTFFVSYIVGFGWSSSSCSGNTKRYFRHFIFSVSYGISNIISPQLWKGNQTKRYYVAWGIQIALSWIGTPIVAGVITLILKARNQERLKYIEENPYALYGTIIESSESGEKVSKKVDIGNLDLTDLENKTFIYPL